MTEAPRHPAGPGRALALAALLALPAGAAAGQSYLHRDAIDTASQIDESTIGFRRGSVVAAPVPIVDPTIGSGLALGAGYLFNLDAESDVSVIGLGGFKTDNGSRGYAAGGKLAFGGGTWTVRGGLGYADLTYDLYPAGRPVEITQTGALASLGASYSLSPAVSVGLDLGYVQSEIASGGARLPPALRADFGISAGVADLLLEYDTRDSTIFPTRGLNATLRAGRGAVIEDAGGGPSFSRGFGRGVGLLSGYLPVPGEAVVAGQLALCGVDAQTPFFLACALGGTDSFRGYPSTEYIDDSLASLQVALRLPLYRRLGAALFAGSGRVAGDMGELWDAEALNAAGAGLRYRLSKRYPVDFSVDVAVNGQSHLSTYVYVGQRF